MRMFIRRNPLLVSAVLLGVVAIVAALLMETQSPSKQARLASAGGRQPALLGNLRANAYVPSTSPLDTSTINTSLQGAFAIFTQRPAYTTQSASSSVSSSSRSTADAAFTAEVPGILSIWQSGHASTIMGQTSPGNAELISSSSGTPLLVLAGTEGACLAAPAPTGGGYVATCAPAASVTSQGLGLQETGADEMLGIVPNGNSSVAVSEQDGQTVDQPVVNNSFVLFGSSLPVKADYTTAQGGPSFMEGSS